MSFVVLTCCLVVAVVLVLSAVGKVSTVAARSAFAASTRHLLPRRLRRVATPEVVASSELAVAVAVTVPATATVGLAAALVAFLAFTGVLVGAVRRDVREPCRCFGASSRPVGAVHVARNAGLVGVCLAALAGLGTGSARAPLVDPAGVLAAATAVVVAVVVSRLDDLLGVWSMASVVTRRAERVTGRSSPAVPVRTNRKEP